MEKRWAQFRDKDKATSNLLAGALNIDPSLAEILVQRNIATFEEARRFFRPSLDHLHDPFLMKGMAAAIDRIKTALQDGEKVLIYGD
jgi:single-stranded-DNA-specific exonuclease